MKKIYIIWNDRVDNVWIPVGMLTCNGSYEFKYTKGAMAENFSPFGNMTDLNLVYRSDQLFPIFSNRVLSQKRPEFDSFLDWLDITREDYDPLDVLALTEGKRITDSLEMFQCPVKNEKSQYEMSFFVHGLRHINNLSESRMIKFNNNERLYISLDIQNPKDANAIMLRSDDPVTHIGYCPRYLTNDFHELRKRSSVDKIEFRVRRFNPEAPLAYRLMCSVTAPWPDDFEPCASENFKPIPLN